MSDITTYLLVAGGILAFQIPLPRFLQLSSLFEEVCAVIGPLRERSSLMRDDCLSQFAACLLAFCQPHTQR